MKFGSEDEADKAGEDEEAVGVERRLVRYFKFEEDKGGSMSDDECKQRLGCNGNDVHFRNSGHCW